MSGHELKHDSVRRLLPFLLAGMVACAATPIAGFQMDKLRDISYRDLCVSYHDLRKQGRLSSKAQDQLSTVLLEKGMTAEELTAVDADRIFIGMSQEAMYASLGECWEENRTVGRWGVHIQHIYGSRYVYTEDGKITSWQDRNE